MENILETLSVPTIAAIIYAVMSVLTKATNGSEKFKRFIPLLSLVFGAVFGLLIYWFVPEMNVATSAFMAIVVGAASGLTATGCDQIIKQMSKVDTNTKTDENGEEDKE